MKTHPECDAIIDRLKARWKRVKDLAYHIVQWFHPKNLGCLILVGSDRVISWFKGGASFIYDRVRRLWKEVKTLCWDFAKVVSGTALLALLALIFLFAWHIGAYFFPAGRACDMRIEDLGDGRVYLEQCWSWEERRKFYTTHEGSLIIPYELVKYLELHDSRDLFLSAKTIEKYKFIPLGDGDFVPFSTSLDVDADGVSPRSPGDWPLGFVNRDVPDGTWAGKWFGVTCAACHTAQLEFKKDNQSYRIRIDGAPSMGDLNGFLQELYASLKATLCGGIQQYGDEYVAMYKEDHSQNCKESDGSKFERYRKNFPNKTVTQVLGLLKVHVEGHKSWHERNDPPSALPHGFGRLDAFGVIYNQLLNFAGTRESARPPDAPVSYPFLWDTSRHDWTQWNGISPRIPKGRNMGQVIGTFGKFEFPPTVSVVASIPLDNLRALQQLVDILRSPAWPEPYLGKIHQEKKDRGRTFYYKKCVHCHAVQERDQPLRRINVHLADASLNGSLGTDPTMTFNAQNRKTQEPDGPIKIQSILVNSVVYVLGHPNNWLLHPWEGFDTLVEVVSPLAQCTVEYLLEDLRLGRPWRRCIMQDESKTFYKGRPLDGIWATAPYLHNGSVANLYELMLPQDERMAGFCVGRREFDAEKVGFKNFTERECRSHNLFWLDTTKKGSWNSGHEYGAKRCDKADTKCREVRDKDIFDVIEYMKSL